MIQNRYRSLVRASAAYDLLATAAFATPWTFHLMYGVLGQLSPLPPFAPTHLLFANMLGSIVVVWSVLRLWNPQPVFGLFDAAARGLFFTWQLYYLLAMHGAPIVWFFAAIELTFGVTQGYGYWLLHKVRTGASSRCRVVQHFATTA